MSSPRESLNDQCIGNLCVDKIQSPRIGDEIFCEWNASHEIFPPVTRFLCEWNSSHEIYHDHWCLFNDFLLANRSLLVFPIRKRPVQNLARKKKKSEKKLYLAVLTRARADSVFGNLPDRVFPSIVQAATPSHLQHSQKES